MEECSRVKEEGLLVRLHQFALEIGQPDAGFARRDAKAKLAQLLEFLQ